MWMNLKGEIDKRMPLYVLQLPTTVKNAEFVVEDFGEKHNWTKKSIFWELAY